MAKEVIQDIRDAGGVMTLTDLSGYRAIERGPLKMKIKGLEMLSTPPPGSGALISLALKIMEGNFGKFKQCKSYKITFYTT